MDYHRTLQQLAVSVVRVKRAAEAHAPVLDLQLRALDRAVDQVARSAVAGANACAQIFPPHAYVGGRRPEFRIDTGDGHVDPALARACGVELDEPIVIDLGRDDA